MKVSQEEKYFLEKIYTHLYLIRNFKEFKFVRPIDDGKNNKPYT